MSHSSFIDESTMEKEEVKRQPNGGGFRSHPENINKAGGPPKTHWWTQLLIERANYEDKMKKLKNKELMADALIEKAKTGDIQAIKEFGDRIQGKAPQGIGTLDDEGGFREQSISVVFMGD